jgi:hypothetical protein
MRFEVSERLELVHSVCSSLSPLEPHGPVSQVKTSLSTVGALPCTRRSVGDHPRPAVGGVRPSRPGGPVGRRGLATHSQHRARTLTRLALAPPIHRMIHQRRVECRTRPVQDRVAARGRPPLMSGSKPARGWQSRSLAGAIRGGPCVTLCR